MLFEAIPVQRSNQQSYQGKWELVIVWTANMPLKGDQFLFNGSLVVILVEEKLNVCEF